METNWQGVVLVFDHLCWAGDRYGIHCAGDDAMSNIVFNVAGIYFNAFKSGEKTHEFRLHNEFWIKRLVGRQYDSVIIACGYPKHGQADKRQVFKWKGYDIRTITHPHFGESPVQVFAIDCTERI